MFRQTCDSSGNAGVRDCWCGEVDGCVVVVAVTCVILVASQYSWVVLASIGSVGRRPRGPSTSVRQGGAIVLAVGLPDDDDEIGMKNDEFYRVIYGFPWVFQFLTVIMCLTYYREDSIVFLLPGIKYIYLSKSYFPGR